MNVYDDKLLDLPFDSPLNVFRPNNRDIIYINKEGNVTKFFFSRLEYRQGLDFYEQFLAENPGFNLVDSWKTNREKYDGRYYIEMAYPYFIKF